MENTIEKSLNYDKAGILFSGLCLLHCLALPLLSSIMPSITVFFEAEWVHMSLLVLVVPIALLSFFKSRNIHGNNHPLIFGMIGITSLVGAMAFEEYEALNLEGILTLIGSVFLISAHLSNIKCLKR